MADEKNGPDRTHATSPPTEKGTVQRGNQRMDGRTLFRSPSAAQPALATAGDSTATGSTNSSTPSLPSSSDWQITSPSQWENAPKVTLTIGSVLKERFTLERVVGKGGMGTVYCARDRRKDEAQDRLPFVAVKVLNEDFKRHPEGIKLLQRESRKAQQLAHPNIVTVFDFDRDGANVFIVMELLEGQSLDRIIKATQGNGLPVDEALHIARALAEALAYAHKKNVIHCDFKPANAYVTDDDNIKILDFGIARVRSREESPEPDQTKLRMDELGALTPSYASLEMLNGESPDPRDDIYALGCVTYELLTGKHPYGRQSAKFALEYNLKVVKPKRLSSRQWAALREALALNREGRTNSVEKFITELTSKQKSWWIFGSIAAAVVALAVGFGWWQSNRALQTARPVTEIASSARPVVAVTPSTVVKPNSVGADPGTKSSSLLSSERNAREQQIKTREQQLLEMARANDVMTAQDVLVELRAQLPADNIFISTTAPSAIGAAHLRLIDRALQRADYSAASNYLQAAQRINATLPGLRERKEAVNAVTKLLNSLRTDTTLTSAAILARMTEIRNATPNSYAAIESNLTEVFADRIIKEQHTDVTSGNALLAVAKQTFGYAPRIAALKKVAEPVVNNNAATVHHTPTSETQPVPPAVNTNTPAKSEPVVVTPKQESTKPEPATPKAEEDKPRKKPAVIVTF